MKIFILCISIFVKVTVTLQQQNNDPSQPLFGKQQDKINIVKDELQSGQKHRIFEHQQKKNGINDFIIREEFQNQDGNAQQDSEQKQEPYDSLSSKEKRPTIEMDTSSQVPNDIKFQEGDKKLKDAIFKNFGQSQPYQKMYKEFTGQEFKYEETNSQKREAWNDDQCPQAYEPFIKFQDTAGKTNAAIMITDAQVRQGDRMMFLVGTRDANTDPTVTSAYTRKCFFGKMDYTGAYSTSSYLSHSSATGSECQAISLTENNDLISVGLYTFASGKTSALIVKTDQNLLNGIVKIWSQSSSGPGASYNQRATDVDVTSDGGIYVTGFLTGWSWGSNDCFVLRLDNLLNVIYARSWGSVNDDQCWSIQVNRNNDYIYIGGYKMPDVAISPSTWREASFYKLDGTATYIYFSLYLRPTSSTDQIYIKRIILTQKAPHASFDNDNNYLYFCGYSSARNGDYIYGRLDAHLNPSYVYQYGSTSAESANNNNYIYQNNLNCALTPDNQYFIGLFGTSNHVSSGVSMNNVYYGSSNADRVHPFYCNWNQCANLGYDDYADLFTTTGGQATLVQRCGASFSSAQMINYFSTYYSSIYSWHACQFNTYDLYNSQCYITTAPLGVTFPQCYYPSETATFTANCNGWWSTCPSCVTINYINKWNSDQLWADAFRSALYTIIKNAVPSYMWDPLYFCNSGSTQMYVFDQDCYSTSDSTAISWYIFKFATRNIADVNNIPEAAAYFGQWSGNLYGTALAVDEYGFISIFGMSDADAFYSLAYTGAVELNPVWAKTHWDLAWETQWSTGRADNWRQLRPWRGDKFTVPKKFKNSDNAGYNFNILIYSDQQSYTAGSITVGAYTGYTPYVINEMFTIALPTITSPTDGVYTMNFIQDNALVDGGRLQLPYGYSQVTMPNQYIYNVVKGSKFSFVLPTLCSTTYDYANKLYQFVSEPDLIKEGTSISFVQGTTALNSAYIMGTFNTLGEGIYYTSDYKVTLWSGAVSTTNTCPYAGSTYQQNNIYNTDNDQALKRFAIGVRLKWIVDDPAIDPPQIVQDIPDQKPVVGWLTTVDLNPITKYFSVTCQYQKARQSQGAGSTQGTQLPYWISYFERNNSFIMYPPDYTTTVLMATPPIKIELVCCNAIDQCVTNAFSVTPIDTKPTMLSSVTSTVITVQYDNAQAIGQHFTWSLTIDQFYPAHNTTLPYSTIDQVKVYDIYLHQAHTVWLFLFSTAPNAINAINFIGMIYGEAVPSSSFGTNTVYFYYNDQYNDFYTPTNTRTSGSFKIIVNRMPQSTTTGVAYQFSNQNPSAMVDDSWYIDLFPWLADQSINIVYVDTSAWFIDADNDKLTYSCTMSDNTLRPNWIGYDTTNGQLRGLPSNSDCLYMNLKITATDTKKGSYSYYKTILVDSAPVISDGYINLQGTVGQGFSHNFSQYFSNGCNLPMTLSLSDTTAQAALRNIGIDFYPPTGLLAGYPTGIIIYSFIPITATDIYGSSATTHFTITINDVSVYQRTRFGKIPDQTFTTGYRFMFEIDNRMFVNTKNGSALVLYATDQSNNALPSWVNFNPITRIFFGVAPNPIKLNILVTAMNIQTQDSVAAAFNLFIVANNNPKMIAKMMNYDYQVNQGDWFEVTYSMLLFKDYETNYYSKVTVKGSNGQAMPSWLSFNSINRTVYGQATQLGTSRVDLTFTDDAGAKALCNIRVQVVATVTKKFSWTVQYLLLGIFSGSLLIYFVYAQHFHLTLIKGNVSSQQKINKINKRVRERFGKYND